MTPCRATTDLGQTSTWMLLRRMAMLRCSAGWRLPWCFQCSWVQSASSDLPFYSSAEGSTTRRCANDARRTVTPACPLCSGALYNSLTIQAVTT